jgi:hypothetical protein
LGKGLEDKIGAWNEAMELIGSTLEETAYHEAGHIVIASAVGLDLRPRGIYIWEEPSGITEGIACYWEDAETEQVLIALRAGQMAQHRQFPESEMRGSLPDIKAFDEAVKIVFGQNRLGEMYETINAHVGKLLTAHWHAIVAVALAVVGSAWIPVTPDDWMPMAPHERSIFKRRKHLDGEEIVGILKKHGLSAQVRP